MSNKLHETADTAMKKALDSYYDGVFELNYVPERVSEILEQELNCAGQTVYTRWFWLEDNDADLDCVLDETIGFCIKHKVKDYAIVLDDSQELVFVVYLLNEMDNLE